LTARSPGRRRALLAAGVVIILKRPAGAQYVCLIDESFVDSIRDTPVRISVRADRRSHCTHGGASYVVVHRRRPLVSLAAETTTSLIKRARLSHAYRDRELDGERGDYYWLGLPHA
jgi:hypothetical protein